MRHPFTVRAMGHHGGGWVEEWRRIKPHVPIEVVVSEWVEPLNAARSTLCPFHDDRTPSFSVRPEHGSWRCWAGCGHGDAADLVARLEGVGFAEAVKRLADRFNLSVGNDAPTRSASSWRPPRPAPKAPPGPSGLSADDAERIAHEAVERLWSQEGAADLSYLRDKRFLSDETIRRHRLGCVHNLVVPKADGSRTFTVSGVLIPWFEGGLLVKLNVRLTTPWRRRDGKEQRYFSVFGDRPVAYPDPADLEDRPLVVCEGELDALLLSQELGDVADVITCGGASGAPHPEALDLAEGRDLYLATDADDGGDGTAKHWPERRIRVRPPEKDWGAVRAGGHGRIAYTWGRYLPIGEPLGPEDFADPSFYASLDTQNSQNTRNPEWLAEARAEALAERRAIMEADGLDPDQAAGHCPAAWLAELNRLNRETRIN